MNWLCKFLKCKGEPVAVPCPPPWVPCPDCLPCPDCPDCPEPPPPPDPPPPDDPIDPKELDHIKIVAFCAGRNRYGCFKDGADWNNYGGVAHLRPNGMYIYLSGTFVAKDGTEIHSYHPSYPGPMTGLWSQYVIQGDLIDTGDPWASGHNITLNNMDFPTINTFTIEAHGVRGEFRVRVG